MTLHFTCPKCNATLNTTDDQAGEKLRCPHCNQRVQVPGNDQSKTMLGKLVQPKGQATILLEEFCTGPDYDPARVFASVFGQISLAPLSTPNVQELLNSDWRSLAADDFEHFLVDVFRALGYSAEKVGKSGDKGRDILLTIGSKRICVQAKGSEKDTIGDQGIGEALKGRDYWGLDYCMAITNSKFTGPARETARGIGCGIIDGNTIRDLICGLLIPPAYVLLGGARPRRPASAQEIERTISPQAGMCLAYTRRGGDGRWYADLSLLGGPCLGPFGDQRTAHAALNKWLLQNEPAHAPSLSPESVAPNQQPNIPAFPVFQPYSSPAEPVPIPYHAQPTTTVPNPFDFGAKKRIGPRRFGGTGFLGPIALLLGTIACAMMTSTKRPRNGCGACGRTWYPRGANASQECPRCGSSSVVVHPEALAVGWVILVVTGAVMGLGICVISFALLQNAHRRGTAVAQTANQGRSTEPEGEADARKGIKSEPSNPAVRREERLTVRDRVKLNREALKTGDRAARIHAADTLSKIGDQAAEAVPELIKLTQETDDELRIAGIQALAQIGPPARSAIPFIVEYLTSSNERIQLLTVTALRRLGSPAAPEFPTLLVAARNQNLTVRAYAVEAMGAVGAVAVPALTEALKDTELPVRAAAANALGNLGPDALPARPDLEKALQDREGGFREAAAGALVKIGPDPATAPMWLVALKDNDTDLASHAVKALEKIGRLRKEELPAAIDLLKSDRAEVRVLSASLLGATEADVKLGKESKPAITALIRALRDPVSDVRQAAAVALGKIGGPAWSAAGPLGNKLNDNEPSVRKAAVAALIKLGPDAWGATASLIPALKDRELHDDVARALVGIGKEAVNSLVRRLEQSRDYNERLDIVNVLGQMGPEAKAAFHPLTLLANGSYGTLSREAKDALAKIQRKQ